MLRKFKSNLFFDFKSTYFFAKLSFNSILNFLKLRPESKSDVFVEFSPMPLIKFVIVFNWRFSSIKTSCFSDSFSLFSILILEGYLSFRYLNY